MSNHHLGREHYALSHIFVVETSCKIHSTPDKVYLIHNGCTHTLNQHAMYALSLCNGQNTVDNILTMMKAKYSTDSKSISALFDFFDLMYTKGVLVDSLGSTPPSWLHSYSSSIDKGLYHPHSISIELTDFCNVECTFCYRDAHMENGKYLHQPIEFLKRKAAKGVNWVEFTGGEPLLHPDFVDILAYSLSEFHNVGIITNGILLSDDILNLLSEHKSQCFVQVSLHSVDPIRYKSITGVDAVDTVLCNIKKLSAFGIRLRVASLIIDDDSIYEIDDIVNCIIDMGASLISPGFVVDFGRGYSVADKFSLTAISLLESKLKMLKEKFGNKLGWEPSDNQTSSVLNRVNCGAGSSRFCYDPMGKVRPCAMFPSEYGQIDEFDPLTMKFMRELQEPGGEVCFNCKYYNDCRGCILKGWLKYKTIHNKCKWGIKNNIDYIISK